MQAFSYHLNMTNENTTLNLDDLDPRQTEFKVRKFGERTFKLKVFSLAERIWLNKRFGKEEVKRIFLEQDIACMAEIAHHLLLPDDKKEFPEFMDFAGILETINDQIAVTKALLGTIGIDDKLILSLSAKLDGENPNAKAVDPTP